MMIFVTPHHVLIPKLPVSCFLGFFLVSDRSHATGWPAYGLTGEPPHG